MPTLLDFLFWLVGVVRMVPWIVVVVLLIAWAVYLVLGGCEFDDDEDMLG